MASSAADALEAAAVALDAALLADVAAAVALDAAAPADPDASTALDAATPAASTAPSCNTRSSGVTTPGRPGTA